MRGSREPAFQALTSACTEGTERGVVGEEFRRLRRKALKLSQAKLAHRLGVTPTSIARWERSERPISELTGRFVRVLAAIEAKAAPDLAARVARLLTASNPNRSNKRASRKPKS